MVQRAMLVSLQFSSVISGRHGKYSTSFVSFIGLTHNADGVTPKSVFLDPSYSEPDEVGEVSKGKI
jgi:hypothetical protein